MKYCWLLGLLGLVWCGERLLTKEYVEQLKGSVTWEVEDYETNIFRDWTLAEVQSLLANPQESEEWVPAIDPVPLPSRLDWRNAKCDHGVLNQGSGLSVLSLVASRMLADRCCLGGSDHGVLSLAELGSCSGLPLYIGYMQKHHGLVPLDCMPSPGPCPTTCVNGKDFEAAHVCNCEKPRSCSSNVELKACLVSGPVPVTFMVCASFMSYKSGIYKCDCSNYIGGHAALAMGYSDSPSCNYLVQNSWGRSWGEQGYFHIACETCLLKGLSICEKVS